MNFPHVLSTLMRATRTRTALTFRTNTMYIPLGGAHNGEGPMSKPRNGEASIPSASKNSASPWPCSQESHDPGGSLTHTRRERLTGVRMPWGGRCIDLGISKVKTDSSLTSCAWSTCESELTSCAWSTCESEAQGTTPREPRPGQHARTLATCRRVGVRVGLHLGQHVLVFGDFLLQLAFESRLRVNLLLTLIRQLVQILSLLDSHFALTHELLVGLCLATVGIKCEWAHPPLPWAKHGFRVLMSPLRQHQGPRALPRPWQPGWH